MRSLQASVGLPHGGRLYLQDSSTVVAIWPEGDEVSVKNAGGLCNIAVAPLRTRQVHGLLGDGDGNRANDFALRDGSVLAGSPTRDQVYGQFGESWRVTAAESLFDYGAGQSPATFADCTFPDAPVKASSLPPAQYASASTACKGTGVTDPNLLDACILDVGASNDTTLAALPPTVTTAPPTPAIILDGNVITESSIVFTPPGFTTLAATPTWGNVSGHGNVSGKLIATTAGKLPVHKGVTVTFDLHVVGPWQNEPFALTLGAVTRAVSFSNVMNTPQSFPELLGASYPAQSASVVADVLAPNPGTARAVYHFRYRFDHADTTQPLSLTLQGPSDAGRAYAVVVNLTFEIDQGAKEWQPGTAARSCADILSLGQAHGDGVYNVEWQDLSGTVDLPVYCDTASDGGGWTMVYKKSTGVALSPLDSWTTGPRNERHTELLDRNKATLDYASSLITHAWSKFTAARVEVVVGGVPVKTIRYDLTGTDLMSWFSPTHYVSGGWSDIPRAANWQGSADGRFYSITGNGTGRLFYINNNWSGCPNDRGWLLVSLGPGCPYETPPNTVFYSALDTMALAINTAQFKPADALVVMLR